MSKAVFLLGAIGCLMFAPRQSMARNYGMGGCGLGSIVMGKDGGQISAATTNGTSYSQVGGITSGTSNCEPDEAGKTSITVGQQNFVKKNFAMLQREVAQGNGETLVAFSESLGCDRATYSEFTQELQKSYTELFSSPGALAMLDATKQTVKRNPTLASSCQHLYEI